MVTSYRAFIRLVFPAAVCGAVRPVVAAGLAAGLVLAVGAPAAAQVSIEARTPAGGAAAPGALPLVAESLRISIDRQFAKTVLEQAYVNDSGARLEGRALVRAGGAARVQGFAYWNGETKIVGEVFEKETARRVYAETTGQLRDPALLEQVGEGAFAFRVFPIEPRERKRIEVTLGQRLPRHGARVEYRLPLGPVVTDIALDLDDDRGVSNLTSPTHTLTVVELPNGVRRVRARAPAPTRELVVQYDVAEKPFSPSVAVHRDAGEDAYLSIAMPTAPARDDVSAKDVTLVLDHSGSMSGEPMAEARAAAAAVVERLKPQDRVNVIAFDDGVDLLYGAPRAVTDAVRREATAYIDRIREAGGTDLGRALSRALAAQVAGDAGRPRVVLFFTDGQSPAPPVFEAARKDPGDARVFTVGLGTGVDKPLLSRLAAEKRGRFTFIESADAIKPRVERLFSQIEAPVMVGVQVEVEGARLARVYPQTIPDLAAGDELVVAARASGTGPVTLKVKGLIGGRPVTYEKAFDLPAAARRPWVGRMWAAARTDDLQEQIALNGETIETRNEVVDLALAYNFVTPFTSFLAIPESELGPGAKRDVVSARERKQAILDARPDAAALSRDEMPPGDPVLTVAAPADARQVTAYFPFGLVKDLAWDQRTQTWKTRFLVPKEVPDGRYAAQVFIVRADGATEIVSAAYTIDSTAPDFEVEAEAVPGGVRVTVTTAEPAREVVVALVAGPRRRVALTRDADGTTFTGVLPLPPGPHELRVVVADAARNEAADTLTCTAGR
jgi:Ca-activated chloride channel family protein